MQSAKAGVATMPAVLLPRLLNCPLPAYRNGSNGSLANVGSYGSYWSSTVDDTLLRFLFFRDSDAYMVNERRAGGLSVRCIRE
jgi:hypothetical protein